MVVVLQTTTSSSSSTAIRIKVLRANSSELTTRPKVKENKHVMRSDACLYRYFSTQIESTCVTVYGKKEDRMQIEECGPLYLHVKTVILSVSGPWTLDSVRALHFIMAVWPPAQRSTSAPFLLPPPLTFLLTHSIFRPLRSRVRIIKHWHCTIGRRLRLDDWINHVMNQVTLVYR